MDLLLKLLPERIPLQAVLSGPVGTYASFFGFVDSVTNDEGVVISESGPPIDVSRGYLRFTFNVGCTYWYGEIRELPDAIRASVSQTRGESALSFVRTETGERLTLFFTL